MIFFVIALLVLPGVGICQTYEGTQSCRGCHSTADLGGLQYPQWQNTLHAKIHQVPDDVSVKPAASFTSSDSIDLGAEYSNAKVYLSKTGNSFYAKVGASGITYRIAWTFGGGFKQKYLVKIDTSYYVLPIQYNLKAYMDNSSNT